MASSASRLPGCAALLLCAATAGAADSLSASPATHLREAGGRLRIEVDGKLLGPTLYFGNNQFGRDEVLFEEARQAAGAGVDILSFNVMPPWMASPEATEATVARFLAAHPRAYLYPRIWVGPPAAWMRAHPRALLTWGLEAPGERPLGYGEWASPSAPDWQRDAAEQLRQLLRWFQQSGHASRLIGTCLINLNTGEWFYPWAEGFPGYGEDDRRAFGEWLRRKYQDDDGLRAAWGQPAATLDTPPVPSPQERQRGDYGHFLQGPRGRWVRDFHEFLSDMVSDAVLGLARTVKEESRGRLLVGVFGAYTIELNGNGPNSMVNGGQLTFRRVVESPDTDIIHSPYSYFDRALGQPANYPLAVDSLRLHGKLGIFEDDTFTHLAQAPGPQLMAPGYPDRTTDLAGTMSVVARNLGLFFTHRGAAWVMDLLSDGRWSAPEVWQERTWLDRLYETPAREREYCPQVAVIVDASSAMDMASGTWPLLYHSLYTWRWEWSRLGTQVGYYEQGDLDRVPESVRLLIFADAYHIDDQQEAILERRFKRDGRVLLFTYAPGVMGPEGFSVARAERVCGVRLASGQSEGPLCVDVRAGALQLGQDLVYGEPTMMWSPSVWADDAQAQVLGCIHGSDRPGLVLRDHPGWTAAYSVAPRVPVPILRRLCERAGAHVYLTPADDPLAPACGLSVDAPFVFVHTDTARTWHLRFPRAFHRLTRLEQTGARVLATDACEWTGPLPAQETVILKTE